MYWAFPYSGRDSRRVNFRETQTMRRAESAPATRRFVMPAVLFATLLAVLPAGIAGAQGEVTFIPVAPPEGAELPYDIPVPAWLAPGIIGLKAEFTDGIATEFSDIAENETDENLRILIEAGEELAASCDRVGSAVRAIGELDVTFGIDGISRIIPAEGALRDTFFGFVVWHETSRAESRGRMEGFEGMVGQIAAAGEASAGLAAGLATGRQQFREAVDAGDAERMAELAPGIIETAARINGICLGMGGASDQLGALITDLSADCPEILLEPWGEATVAVAAVRAPAQHTPDALASISNVLYLLIDLGVLLEDASSSVERVSATPDADGNVHVPWTTIRDDWETLKTIEQHVFAGGPEEEPQDGEEHDHAHHGHEHHAVPEDIKARVRALYAHQVAANRILAERAVEHTSTLVARVGDDLEEYYLERAGFSTEDDQRQQQSAMADADEQMRQNMEFASTKMSARACRAALDEGDKMAARGTQGAVEALYWYQNAWLHALNAGAAAQRAARTVPIR